MDRILCCFLSFSLILGNIPNQDVTVKDRKSSCFEQAIVQYLCDIETDKKEYGLQSSDFDNLYLGNTICFYAFFNNEVIKIKEASVIISGTKAILLAFDNGGVIQFDSELPGYEVFQKNKTMAIIYAKEGCYLFNGIEYFPLFEYNINNTKFSKITDLTEQHINQININDVTEIISRIDYHGNNSPKSIYYFSLNVGYISQNPYASLCWLASTAMISNYVIGTSYNLQNAYNKYMGASNPYSTNYNIQDFPLGSDTMLKNVMNNKFGLSYYYGASVLSQNTVYNNIGNNYPVMGIVNDSTSTTGSKHAVVIYGADFNEGYFSIKDPLMGSVTVYPSNNYGYYNTHWPVITYYSDDSWELTGYTTLYLYIVKTITKLS